MSTIHTFPAKAFVAAILAGASIGPVQAAMPEGVGPDHNASRNNVERYYWSHRLVGSHVLNMQGQNIGRVNALVVDERGTLTKMLVTLNDRFDVDGMSVPVEPNRAEIVSAGNAKVTIIRIDLTRDELLRAQLSQLQSRAKSPNTEPGGRDPGDTVAQ